MNGGTKSGVKFKKPRMAEVLGGISAGLIDRRRRRRRKEEEEEEGDN
jgi:hypothetical protein